MNKVRKQSQNPKYPLEPYGTYMCHKHLTNLTMILFIVRKFMVCKFLIE